MSVPTPTRRSAVLGVTAVLALSLAVVTASAGASGWHASSAGNAVVAKKKCKKKKKGKKSAAVAKKKKCKKQKAPVPTLPTAPKPPLVRAQISWNTDAQIDLHAWSNGLHDGWSESAGTDGADEIEIAGTTYTHNLSSEQITDSSNPSTIPLTFTICNYGDVGTTDITVQVLYADGTVDNEQFDGTTEGDFFADPFQQGGSPGPLADWCPAAVP